jgi:hypothetical protein
MNRQADQSGQSGQQHRRAWPVLLLALPAFVAIWSGWVELGRMTGFGPVKPLPGIWDDATINTAITLPIGVETYAAYAMYVWLSMDVTARARRFAKVSAIGSLALGAGGQLAYHLLAAAGYDKAPWQITALVACLPVAVLGMGAALAHLVGQAPEHPLLERPVVDEQPEPNPDPQPEVESFADLGRQEDYVLMPPRPLVAAHRAAAERPIRGVRVVQVQQGHPGPDWSTRAFFEAREDGLVPWLPMTAVEIMEREGGSKRSAESKMYRWRKAKPVA